MLHKPTPQVSAGLQPGVGVRRELVNFICPLPPVLPSPSIVLSGASIVSSALIYMHMHHLSNRVTPAFVFLTSPGPSAARTSVPLSHHRASRKRVPTGAGFAETQGKGHARSCSCKGTLTSGSRLACGEARLSLVHCSVPWSPFSLGDLMSSSPFPPLSPLG